MQSTERLFLQVNNLSTCEKKKKSSSIHLFSPILWFPLAKAGNSQIMRQEKNHLCQADTISIDEIWPLYLQQWSCHYT